EARFVDLPATNLPGILGSQAGVVLAYDATAGTFLSAVLDKTLIGGLLGEHVLLRCTCSPTVDLASVDASLSGGHTLRLTRDGAQVTVRLDGAVVLSHALSGAQSSALAGGRAGLWTNN